jgi:hypothetical protein
MAIRVEITGEDILELVAKNILELVAKELSRRTGHTVRMEDIRYAGAEHVFYCMLSDDEETKKEQP